LFEAGFKVSDSRFNIFGRCGTMGYGLNGLDCQDLGQLDRALESQEKAVAILAKLFPNSHPNLDIMKKTWPSSRPSRARKRNRALDL
jgi:S-methylmethionine-dependent homocysteine/selenocysteine methylase